MAESPTANLPKFTEIGEQERQDIRLLSAWGLPDSPTGRGWKPADVKRALADPVVGYEKSVFALIRRMSGELIEYDAALHDVLEQILAEADAEHDGIRKSVSALSKKLFNSRQARALDALFSAAAYAEGAVEEYAEFRAAFGLDGSVDPEDPDEPYDPEEPDDPDDPEDPDSGIVINPDPGYETVWNIAGSELKVACLTKVHQKGTNGFFKYCDEQTVSRASYVDFDIMAVPGETYRFRFDATSEKIRIGVELYTVGCMDKVKENKEDSSYLIDYQNPGTTSVDAVDLDWHESGFTYTVPYYLVEGNEASMPCAFRITFKGETFTVNNVSKLIKSVTVKRFIRSVVAPDEGAEIVKSLTGADLKAAYLGRDYFEEQNGYYGSATKKRASYVHFKDENGSLLIPAEPGYAYEFSFEKTTEQAMKIGPELYTINAITSKVGNNKRINMEGALKPTVDALDLDWQDSGYIYDVPHRLIEGVDASKPSCFRFTIRFEPENSGSFLDENGAESIADQITSVTIRRWQTYVSPPVVRPDPDIKEDPETGDDGEYEPVLSCTGADLVPAYLTWKYFKEHGAYCNPTTNRLSYVKFVDDAGNVLIPAVPGETYRFEFEATNAAIRIGVELYTKGCIAKVTDEVEKKDFAIREVAGMPTEDADDLGWQDSGFTYTVPSRLVADSPESIPAAFRFTFWGEGVVFKDDNKAQLIKSVTVKKRKRVTVEPDGGLEIFKVVSGSALKAAKLQSAYRTLTKGYYYPVSDRASYVAFDIAATPGYTYRFSFKAASESIRQIGLEMYSVGALEKVEDNDQFDIRVSTPTLDAVDLGWQENGFIYTVPDHIIAGDERSVPAAFRFTFEGSFESDADVAQQIESVTIERWVE